MLKSVKCNESKTGSVNSPMPWDKTFLTKLLKVSSAGVVVVFLSRLFHFVFFVSFRFLRFSSCLCLYTFAC